MDRFVKELEHARGVVGERAEVVRRVFADPAAARLAISLATRDSPLPKDTAARLLALPGVASRDRRPDLVTFLRDLNDLAAADATSADAFGRMLAAAAGAYDEKDGAHSDVAARFAFAVMTGTPGFRFAPPTRVHLAEVAGAYATEMTEGETVREHVHVLETALDRACAQFGGEPVWVGPAARAFAEELNGRRARLKSAVQHVIAELEAELRATPAKVSRSAAMSG